MKQTFYKFFVLTMDISSFNEICRICLNQNSIHELSTQHKKYSKDYFFMLNICASIQAEKNDNLPHKICSRCEKVLVTYYSFRQTIIKNDIKLKETYERQINQSKTLNIIKNIDLKEMEIDGGNPSEISPIEIECILKEPQNIYIKKVPDNEKLGPNILEEALEDTPDLLNINKIKEEIIEDYEILNKQTEPEIKDGCANKNESVEFKIKDGVFKQDGEIETKPIELTVKDGASKTKILGNGMFKCEFCGKSFNYRCHLLTHIRIHTGEKPYKCDVCDKSFRKSGNLKTHKLLHTDETQECRICKMQIRHSAMKWHIEQKHGSSYMQKPHICTICNKSFAYSSTLQTHILSHTKSRPFTCEICKKSYARLSHLNRHMTRVCLPYSAPQDAS